MTQEEQNTNMEEVNVGQIGLAPTTEEDAQELSDEIQEERTAQDEEVKEDTQEDGQSGEGNEIPEGYREATEEEIKEMRLFSEMFKGKSPITVMMDLNERIIMLEKKVF